MLPGVDRGRGKSRLSAATVAIVTLLVVGTGAAHAAKQERSAWVPASLYDRAAAHPDETFDVVVRGVRGDSSASVAKDFAKPAGRLKRQFFALTGAAGSLTGAELVKLAGNQHVLSITPDTPVVSTGYVDEEQWRESTAVSPLWSGGALVPAPKAPAIAVVDSGIDASRIADFGARVVASVNLSSLSPGATGDDQGHGTMVAGLAAGDSPLYPGVARNAPLVDVRTADATGASRTSDVIAAADWILKHQAQYDIRVANFSMRGSSPTSFRNDPLDAAVESLWFHGIVVVAAVGNYGSYGMATKVAYSPGNDPFAISVGALDTAGTATPSDDFVAPWSAHGHTLDGFAKPDLAAPGRWIVAPVPTGAALPVAAPDRLLAPGYMWMSGTSLSAPIVAGAAAQLLARHPSWTPDQVKGALMQAATPLAAAPQYEAGTGELNAAAAAAIAAPPNPNAGLDAFLTTDPATGVVSFDGAAWTTAAQTDWAQTDWSQTDWAQTDWAQTDWAQTDWAQTDWAQ